MSVHAGRRRLGRVLLVRQRDDVDAADLHRPDRARLPGAVGAPTPACTAHTGPIGTLPWYAENGLVSDGDPAVAFGPRSRARRVQLGQRLAAVLREPDRERRARRAPSRRSRALRRSPSRAPTTRSRRRRRRGGQGAWMAPVLISRQSIDDVLRQGADLGRQRLVEPVLRHGLRLLGGVPRPGEGQRRAGAAAGRGVARRRRHVDASTRSPRRRTTASATRRTAARSAPTAADARTCSASGRTVSGGKQPFEFMSRSTNGGANWSRPQPGRRPGQQPGAFDPVQGRPVIDGVAGARSDLAPAPSVDIANGAPTGADATNRIVMSYVSGPLATPHVFFTESTDRGASWSAPRAIETAGDRGFYTAPAISPNGTDVYVVYNAFTTPFQPTTATPRALVGVVKHADTAGTAPTGAFTDAAPRRAGRPARLQRQRADLRVPRRLRLRGRDPHLRGGRVERRPQRPDCPAIDAWRQALQNGQSPPAPAPQQDCPATRSATRTSSAAPTPTRRRSSDTARGRSHDRPTGRNLPGEAAACDRLSGSSRIAGRTGSAARRPCFGDALCAGRMARGAPSAEPLSHGFPSRRGEMQSAGVDEHPSAG